MWQHGSFRQSSPHLQTAQVLATTRTNFVQLRACGVGHQRDPIDVSRRECLVAAVQVKVGVDFQSMLALAVQMHPVSPAAADDQQRAVVQQRDAADNDRNRGGRF